MNVSILTKINTKLLIKIIDIGQLTAELADIKH